MPTIAAIATAPGAGGIGIVRISGPQSREILSRMFSPASAKFSGFRPWVLHRGRALDHEGAPLDDVLAVFMPGPRTFTGEDVAEIHCHGGPFIVQAILDTALRLGARAAERGRRWNIPSQSMAAAVSLRRARRVSTLAARTWLLI